VNIDWNIVNSAATAIGSMATALGVCFGAWQIKINKVQTQFAFEDSLDQQYRSLSMALPVNVLIGAPVDEESHEQVRELIYNYLDLSNEQVYLRAEGRISKQTWQSWSEGIKLHLKKSVFDDVYQEVKDRSNFTYLDRFIDSDFKSDPKTW
jgi:hypothetical protein